MILTEAKFGEVLELYNGKNPSQDDLGDYDIFGSNGRIGRSKTPNHPSSIILGRVGAYCGSVEYSKEPFWASDNTIVTRPKVNQDLKYWYYKLKTCKLRDYAGGAAQPLITHSIIKPISVIYHGNVDDQKRIAGVLSAYDDLIDNNRRRVALLEEAARLIYREWFVHFRFPGHENTRFENGLPVGWRKKPLLEIANLVMGQSPKSEFYNKDGDGLPFHQGVTDYGARFVNDRVFSAVVTRIAKAGDILFSVRAPVGRLNYTLNKIVLGRGLAGLRALDGNQSHLFYALKNAFFKEDLIGGGSIFASTSKSELENFELIYPGFETLERFESVVRLLDDQVKVFSLQNRALARARDLLLPRLMDGRITV